MRHDSFLGMKKAQIRNTYLGLANIYMLHFSMLS